MTTDDHARSSVQQVVSGTELEPRVCPREAGSGGSGRSLSVAILFARSDSVYKSIEGCDVWDIERDARNFAGGMPVITHPPCRAWGRLAHLAKPRDGEKNLALFAVEMVRRWGGVLEHPATSRVWQACELPIGAARDAFGGFTMAVDQRWWGHRATKATWLYFCGVSPRALPPMPLRIDEGTHYIMQDRRGGTSRNLGKLRLPTSEREATPPALAMWLVQVARLCIPSGRRGCGAVGESAATKQSGACSANTELSHTAPTTT